jgi:deoxycytidylate deaminase
MRVLHYVEICVYYARQSTHPKSRHGAILVRNGKIVNAAHNTLYHHAKCALFTTTRKRFERCRPIYDVYIVRIAADGRLTNSKPCAQCVEVLQKIQLLRRVYYSDENGNIQMTRIRNLQNNHLSCWQLDSNQMRK